MLQHVLTGARLLVGLIWSVGLVAAGGFLLQVGDLPANFPRGAVVASGAAAVVAGHFIFMVLVADRLFPGAWPRAVALCEWAAAGVLALSMAGTLSYAAWFLLT
jgi:hypothetical protein